MKKLLNWLRDLKIDFQRWRFRRNVKISKKYDAQLMGQAITKADDLTRRNNKRFWVLKLSYGDYSVCTKQQVRAYFRNIGLQVNYMQTNEYIIHITKKPN